MRGTTSNMNPESGDTTNTPDLVGGEKRVTENYGGKNNASQETQFEEGDTAAAAEETNTPPSEDYQEINDPEDDNPPPPPPPPMESPLVVREKTGEIKNIIHDFQNVCNKHMEKMEEVMTAITTAKGELQEHQKILFKGAKKRGIQKPGVLYNLIMICTMIVLLMQIHMYILLYNKFNSMHQDIHDVSCIIFGKNCPDVYVANQCLSNKLDYIENEQERNLEHLQRDIEEVMTLISNISLMTMFSKSELPNEIETEEGIKKPPRSETVYIQP